MYNAEPKGGCRRYDVTQIRVTIKRLTGGLPPVCAMKYSGAPVTGEFPAQRASNAETVSIWWRHHALLSSLSNHYLTDDVKLDGYICNRTLY